MGRAKQLPGKECDQIRRKISETSRVEKDRSPQWARVDRGLKGGRKHSGRKRKPEKQDGSGGVEVSERTTTI